MSISADNVLGSQDSTRTPASVYSHGVAAACNAPPANLSHQGDAAFAIFAGVAVWQHCRPEWRRKVP